MNANFVDGLVAYYEQGGFVMPPLIVATFVLWYALGYRIATLRRGSTHGVRGLVMEYRNNPSRPPRGVIGTAVRRALELAGRDSRNLKHRLDGLFGEQRKELKRGRVLIRSIVSAAPLAGLLGTVTGMIETFDSLGEGALFTQTGGIAAGIAQALFTTQLGLAVAVPGVIVGQLLDRRAQAFEQELSQLRDFLCAEHARAQAR